MSWNGFEILSDYVERRIDEFELIPADRKELLRDLALKIASRISKTGPVNLVFICTHNSRRSHMAHLWAQLASYYYNFSNIPCYSGGTEATAFNSNAVSALQEAGMKIVQQDEGSNPNYAVSFSREMTAISAFSKVYTDPPNPGENFIAVMTCSQADEACPMVHGALARVSLNYEDPKEFDGTAKEKEQYAERCAQIAREMLFLFSSI